MAFGGFVGASSPWAQRHHLVRGAEGGEAVQVQGQGTHGKSLHCLLGLVTALKPLRDLGLQKTPLVQFLLLNRSPCF